jgi:hypothetical protein
LFFQKTENLQQNFPNLPFFFPPGYGNSPPKKTLISICHRIKRYISWTSLQENMLNSWRTPSNSAVDHLSSLLRNGSPLSMATNAEICYVLWNGQALPIMAN